MSEVGSQIRGWGAEVPRDPPQFNPRVHEDTHAHTVEVDEKQ